MPITMRTAASALSLLLAVTIGSIDATRGAMPPPDPMARFAPPAVSAPTITRLLELQRFHSDTPVSFRSISGPIAANSGYVLVIEVDARSLTPVDRAAPVLFAGEIAAREVNRGNRSGRMVLLIPEVDLNTTSLYFGPARPLRVLSRESLLEARVQRAAQGAADQVIATLASAAADAGSAWHVTDMNELYRRAAELVIRFAPEESSTAAMYLGATRR
jgi:hypothetical protein